uniref:Vacuolar fusion protein MON1 homolog n=1 Tax=Hucho hucho TaxID=62062 RepID=A0A4W5LRU6_9TELE
MAGDVHNRGVPWEVQQNGTLAPVDHLCNERSESPTTGLVEGTEPGAGQESAMFVHAQSFEDLTADSEVTTEMETERDSVLGESGESVKEEALCLGAEEETQKEQQPEVEVEEVCPESRIKEEDVCSEAWRSHRKHVFVLSEAGKPIYSRYGTEEALSSTMGVMMALVSVVEADNNIIFSIHADGYKVVFLRKAPLVLVGVSRTCQSDRELTRELQYIYYQIVSLLTLTQLNHIFQHKQNYDLGRLLTGCRLPRPRTWSSPSSWLGTAWSPWYARKTSTCTTWNCTCSSTWWASSFRKGEGWTPICLPKFNTAGFFHTHISYLEPASDLCLILVSADREDFFNLSDCKHRFLERLSQRTAYQALKEMLKCPSYSVSQVGIPELRHFLYKSMSSGLYTSPELPLLYQSVEEQERLMGLYLYLHSCLHHLPRPLRSIYRCGETGGIELYLCFSPLGTKAVAVDDRLFVLSPLTY